MERGRGRERLLEEACVVDLVGVEKGWNRGRSKGVGSGG